MQRVPTLSKANWHSKLEAKVRVYSTNYSELSFSSKNCKVLPACATGKELGDGRLAEDI